MLPAMNWVSWRKTRYILLKNIVIVTIFFAVVVTVTVPVIVIVIVIVDDMTIFIIIIINTFTIAFQVRRNVHRKGRDFLFNGSNGENFIKIPSANLHPNGRCIHFGLVLLFSANLEIHWTSFLSALFCIVGPTARKWSISFFFFNSVLLPLKNRIRSTWDWIQQPSGAFYKLLSRFWRNQQNLVCKF